MWPARAPAAAARSGWRRNSRRAHMRPRWQKSSPPARPSGKTACDEFFYSGSGINAHYGTPTNVRAPGRIPGGSSSGSAAAVAANACDFALGSDTGGSVRMPAS
jgi:hypothetical protein